MQNISEIVKKENRKETILQFGEGNFLRAFVDWMIDLSNEKDSKPGDVVIVQPIASGLVDLINEQNGIYTLSMRGNTETGKKIIRSENEIKFSSLGEVLAPYQLSSGEKQILVILLTVLVEDNEHYVLFMDEPEVSLHIEWQKRLIDLILELNPNVQIILTTHSPAVIMNGWIDRVTEVTDITDK